ncbi:glucose-6-phosphate dehydrogenase, C-terminal domain protein, partial [Vibrio parahaemolyticus V-223/04]
MLQCLKPLDETALRNDLVLGQYTASDVRGQHLPGYREENGVADDSRTETYIGLKAYINNWRWNGVPFYVRTGKRLPTRVTEVVIHFKQTPHPVFGQNAPENKLIIRIQPDEGIQMSFGLKEPGAGFN